MTIERDAAGDQAVLDDRFCRACRCVVSVDHRCTVADADRYDQGYKPHRPQVNEHTGLCTRDLWPNGTRDFPCGEPVEARIHTAATAARDAER